MSHFAGGSHVKAVIGISSAIRSIINICTAVMARGILKLIPINKLNNTAKSSPPFEATAKMADFLMF